jgi:hypothetical protein
MSNQSLSIASPAPMLTSGKQKLAVALASIGILLLLITWAEGRAVAPIPVFLSAPGLTTVGVIVFIREEYLTRPEGVKNNGAWFRSLTARGKGLAGGYRRHWIERWMIYSGPAHKKFMI